MGGCFFAQKIGGIDLKLKEYGWNENYREKSKEKDKLIYARVIEVQRNLFKVVCENGETTARLKGTFYKNEDSEFPVVGDFVLMQFNDIGDSLIECICKRISSFSRTDFSGHSAGYVKTIKKQVLAANFDYAFIVSSMNKDFNIRKMTRYITVASQSGAKPVVILTKADLCDNHDFYTFKIREISKDIDIVPISSFTGYGLERLNEYMQLGKTIVLLGSSGVGKSTLVNTIAGENIMNVNGIREDDSKGRHTTTHRQMIMLNNKVMIIDTPGIRELGMWDSEDGINDTFSDVTELISRCKFRNCTHKNELGCAVKKAIEEGELTSEKFEMYSSLVEENKWGASKTAYTKKEKLEQKKWGHYSR